MSETIEWTYQEAINHLYEDLPEPGTFLGPDEGIYFRHGEEDRIGKIKEQYPTSTAASPEGALVVVSVNSEHRLYTYDDIARKIAQGDWRVLE